MANTTRLSKNAKDRLRQERNWRRFRGILGIGQGGTGADNAVDAIENLTDVRIYKTARITSVTTLDTTYDIVFADSDGGAYNVNLPAGVEGTHYKIINCGSSGNDVTLDGNGTETIFGDATFALSDGEIADIHYNATEGWW